MLQRGKSSKGSGTSMISSLVLTVLSVIYWTRRCEDGLGADGCSFGCQPHPLSVVPVLLVICFGVCLTLYCATTLTLDAAHKIRSKIDRNRISNIFLKQYRTAERGVRAGASRAQLRASRYFDAMFRSTSRRTSSADGCATERSGRRPSYVRRKSWNTLRRTTREERRSNQTYWMRRPCTVRPLWAMRFRRGA